MNATSDGTLVLANVHVGGIQRSTDGGVTWRPTIEVDSDVQEVRALPSQLRIVIAASAIGLYISRDGEQCGLSSKNVCMPLIAPPWRFRATIFSLERPKTIS